MSSVVVIANPAAGRGTGARRLAVARLAFARVGVTDIRTTAAPGDEASVVRRAIDDGATTLAILGGDGTWGKCAAAVVAAGAPVRLAFLHGGTGNDFAKNIAAPARDYDAMARLTVGGGHEWRVDIGAVESEGVCDWFLNVAGFGFDAAVLEQITSGGALRGQAVYIAAALRQLMRYPGFDVAVGPATTFARALMLVVSNGRNFGGAFRIAPAALVNDGLLDLVRIGDVRGVARLPLFSRALRGAHLSHPQVSAQRAEGFTLRFADPPAYEVDGELHRARSSEVRVRCHGGVLTVLAASPAISPR